MSQQGGVGKLSSRSILYYENQFKMFTMQKISDGNPVELKSFLNQQIAENPKEYLIINAAFLKMKRELLG